ncbi:uncharacterized protein G2W53_028695 [Senna tora]|uniref:Uncharacterized protein n=1 Tax=Senna tora TaxID=362788 RepID=A0A834T5T9_9FABA|nr:uncharacterized protein G2W53_028695 [Senna tora]
MRVRRHRSRWVSSTGTLPSGIAASTVSGILCCRRARLSYFLAVSFVFSQVWLRFLVCSNIDGASKYLDANDISGYGGLPETTAGFFSFGCFFSQGRSLVLFWLFSESKENMGIQRLAIEAKTFDLTLEQSGPFFRLSSQVQQGSSTQKIGVQPDPVQHDVGVQTEEAEMVTLGDVRFAESAGKGEMGNKMGKEGESKSVSCKGKVIMEPQATNNIVIRDPSTSGIVKHLEPHTDYTSSEAGEGEFFDEASIISFFDNEEGLLIVQLEKEYEEQERDQKRRLDDALEGVASLLRMDVSEGNINDSSRGILSMPEEASAHLVLRFLFCQDDSNWSIKTTPVSEIRPRFIVRNTLRHDPHSSHAKTTPIGASKQLQFANTTRTDVFDSLAQQNMLRHDPRSSHAKKTPIGASKPLRFANTTRTNVFDSHAQQVLCLVIREGF